MSACIYHDVESVAVCPGCDFGVCQDCMDAGTDGVCSTCSEERDLRKQHSALQREYTVEEQVPRCNYCRAATDEETPLDEQGYCPTCTSLARCCLHNDLIAVGHCKSCRMEYCRKCLGFTDICQTCTAKNKTKPSKAAPPPAAARQGGKKKAAAGTTPMKESAGKPKSGALAKEGGGPKAKTGGAAMKGGKAGAIDGKGKGKAGPTRGMVAIEAKMAAKAAPRQKFHIVALGVIGALVCMVGLSGMLMKANSPEEQSKELQTKMVTVHRGIMKYYEDHGSLPTKPNQVLQSLKAMHAKHLSNIKIARKPSNGAQGEAGAVLFDCVGTTFLVTAADSQGKILADSKGNMIYLDQNYNPPADAR